MTDIDSTLDERGKTHGEFTEHSLTCQSLKCVMQNAPNWEELSDVNKEALDMIMHKVARILCGNPNTKDHWVDICGYATLAERECK